MDKQSQVYASLEPVYKHYADFFRSLDIPFISVASGRGWHFVMQVQDPQAILNLAKIGNVIEPTVRDKQKQIPSEKVGQKGIGRFRK